MFYVVAPNGIFSKLVPQYGNQLWDDTHFCPASKLTPEEATQFSVFPLVETPKPAYNPLTHGIAEGTPELDNGAWEQRGVITPLPPEESQANMALAEPSRQPIQEICDEICSSTEWCIFTYGFRTRQPDLG